MVSTRSWFTGVLGRIFSRGTEVELLQGLNFTDGFVATPNRATKLIDVAMAVEDFRGPTGATGATGAKGATGDTGPAAVAGEIPSSYVELPSPVGTTSATLVDVTGMSVTITLDTPVRIAVFASFELQTQSGAAPSTMGVAVSIDGTDHDELKRYLSGSNDQGIGSITHRTDTSLSAGVHTIKLRFRRVSGAATPGINKAHMVVMAMQSAIGPEGPMGAVHVQLTPGATATDITTNTIVASPGVTVEDGYLAFYKGIKGSWVAMNSDGGNVLQTVNLTQRSAAVGNSYPHWFADAHAKVYLCTLGIRTKWYSDSDRTHSGTVDAIVDLLVTSIGSAPTSISAAVIGTVQVDASRAHADFASADVQVASVSNGFSITGVRPAGLACHCKADWAVLDFEDIT